MLIEYLEQLVTFRTLPHNQSESERALLWMEHMLKDLPLFVNTHTIHGFPSRVFTTQKTRHPKLMLVAHMDVVDGADELFLPQKKDGKLIGRGVTDMKFAIATFMHVLRELGDRCSEYDIGVMITSDEEVGSADGVYPLLENEKYGADLCIVPDSGVNWEIQTEGKGGVDIAVVARGTSGHASRPWEGENAIENLVHFLQDMRAQFPARYAAEDGYDKVTVNMGKITGGKETNQIPNAAEAILDIRFPPIMNKETALVPIIETLKRHPAISIEERLSVDAYHIDVAHPALQSFSDITEKHIGRRPAFARAFGSCDARFFCSKGVPSIVLRPRCGGHHGPDEWIDMEDLKRFYLVVRDFVGEVAHK